MKVIYAIMYRSRDMEESEIEASFDKEELEQFIDNLGSAVYTTVFGEVKEILVEDDISQECRDFFLPKKRLPNNKHVSGVLPVLLPPSYVPQRQIVFLHF